MEIIVLNEIENNPRISKYKIAKKHGRTSRTIQRNIDSLRSKGAIRRVGGTKGYWEIIEHRN